MIIALRDSLLLFYYPCYTSLLSLIMSKFVCQRDYKSQSQHHSPITNNNHHKNHKEMREFAQQEQKIPSPLQNRMRNSPLHIPLSIALNRLTSRGESQNTLREMGQYEITRHQMTKNTLHKNLFSDEIQGIKNILQQFAESLYTTLQRQLYSKFNCQMKRMIVKYRQTDKILKKITQKLTLNADILEIQHSYKILRQKDQKKIEQLQKSITQLTQQLTKNTEYFSTLNLHNKKLQQQKYRLQMNLSKYQNLFLKKITNNSNKQNDLNSTNISQTKISLTSNSYPYYQQQTRSKSKSAQSSMTTKPVDLSLSTIHLSNINQLAPSLSPIKQKLSPKPRKCLEPSIINLKRGRF